MENNNENQNDLDINLEEVKETNNDEQIELSNNIDKLDQEVSNQNLESQIVQKEEKKKKKLSKDQIIVICVIVALIVIIGILAWMLLFINKDDNSTNNTQNNEVNNKQEDVINTFEEDDEESEEKEESKYTANIYVSKYDNLCEASDYCKNVAFTIDTESKDIKIYDIEGTKENGFVLYLDNNKFKVFSTKYNKIKEYSKIETNYKSYNMILSKTSDNSGDTYTDLLGIAYNNEESEYGRVYLGKDCKYYDVKEKRNRYDGYCIDEAVANSNFVAGASDFKYDSDGNVDVWTYKLFDNNTGNAVITLNDADACDRFVINGSFIEHSSGCIGGTSRSFYTIQGNKINDLIDGNVIDAYKGKIYLLEDNKLIIVDNNGNKSTLDKYNDYKIIKVSRNHAVGIKDNKLYIINLDEQKEYELGEWKDEYYFHTLISGFYEKSNLTYDTSKEEGYYIIYSYHKGYSDTQDGYAEGREYYFNPNTHEIKNWELDTVGGYAKPVLYLYPTKKTKVNVSFEHNDYLTTTYPKFKDNWSVTAYPNGDLYDSNNKYYYGLYWEEDLNHLVDFNEGFYVEKDSAIEFLEEKLSIIGLNDRERNEFIMYWLPILEKNEKNLVYFELTEERDSYNKLVIEPKVDSMLRMAIHVKKVDRKVNIKEQKLKTFKRKGFSAVEWGGVRY